METPFLSFIVFAPFKNPFHWEKRNFLSKRRICSLHCNELHHKRNEKLVKPIGFMSMSSGSQSDSEREFEEFASEINNYLSSKSTPDDGPLSFEVLQRTGRSDIMSGIIKFGGSIRVAEKLRIDPAMFMPALRAVESKTFPDFYRPETGASLTLGRDLEARLETIDKVKQSGSTNENISSVPRTIDNVPSAEELKRQNDSIVPRVIDEVVLPGETLSLSAEMRFGTLFLATLAALGYGHASDAVLDDHAIIVLRYFVNGLFAAHIGLSTYTGVYMAPRLKRNSFLWFIKVLLSGPFGLRSLRTLGLIESQN